ncbi:MAG TPA: glycosyltransferase family 2 protein [Chitinivibrionales bacterium]|jgi:glycosyltransferase involved in cell wall biosynthesis|nr:glycosyltransferase family 2 protein [Chitinivibrionales bacterium]
MHGGSLIDKKVSVVIPAYNAARTLEEVIARIPLILWESISRVWIINDGSTDDTQGVVDALCAANGKISANHFGINRGYGKAVREGLFRCREDGCDYAVCLHADGQYPPEAIPGFVETMADRGIDLLQGSRIASGTALSGGMPVYKYVANRILTFFENIVFGLSLSDYHSGMLLYSRKALDSLPFDRLSASFDFDLEVIAVCRARGLAIAELPIPTRYAGEVSHLNPVTYGLRVLRVMAEYLAGRYKSL